MKPYYDEIKLLKKVRQVTSESIKNRLRTGDSLVDNRSSKKKLLHERVRSSYKSPSKAENLRSLFKEELKTLTKGGSKQHKMSQPSILEDFFKLKQPYPSAT